MLFRSATSWDLVALSFAIQALIALQRFDEVVPLLERSRVARSLEGLLALLPALGSAPSALVKDIRDWFAQHGVSDTTKTNELLINSYTAEDDFDSLSQMRKEGVPLPARSYVKWAKDALKRSSLYEAAERMTEMRTAGFFVPEIFDVVLVKFVVATVSADGVASEMMNGSRRAASAEAAAPSPA